MQKIAFHASIFLIDCEFLLHVKLATTLKIYFKEIIHAITWKFCTFFLRYNDLNSSFENNGKIEFKILQENLNLKKPLKFKFKKAVKLSHKMQLILKI